MGGERDGADEYTNRWYNFGWVSAGENDQINDGAGQRPCGGGRGHIAWVMWKNRARAWEESPLRGKSKPPPREVTCRAAEGTQEPRLKVGGEVSWSRTRRPHRPWLGIWILLPSIIGSCWHVLDRNNDLTFIFKKTTLPAAWGDQSGSRKTS